MAKTGIETANDEGEAALETAKTETDALLDETIEIGTATVIASETVEEILTATATGRTETDDTETVLEMAAVTSTEEPVDDVTMTGPCIRVRCWEALLRPRFTGLRETRRESANLEALLHQGEQQYHKGSHSPFLTEAGYRMTEEEHEMRSVFVSQLSARVGDRELFQFFETTVGKVRDARVILDRVSRRSKG